MTDYASDIGDQYPLKSSKRDRLLMTATTTIGAAGAVSSTSGDDPKFSTTKNGGTGDYTLTFPKCPSCKVIVQLVSPAGTVRHADIVSVSATSGTANIITGNAAGTATNPASADKIEWFILAETRA